MKRIVLGRFLIHRTLAEGGMGVVLSARDLDANQQVILKMPRAAVCQDWASMERFEHEIDALRSLRHPNIPAWVADGVFEGRRVLAVEHVEGMTVAQLLARVQGRGGLPVAAIPIISDVLRALQAAHDVTLDDGAPRGLVHRDVSPQNIIVDPLGQGHLIDFGASTDASFSGAIESGTVVGKVAYMAPEVVKGAPIGPATDQFAAGIVLWEMLTGRRLFRADTEGTTWKKVLRCEVPHLDDLPGAAADVIARMLQPAPSDRFRSCADAAAALTHALPQELRLRLGPDDIARLRRAPISRPARTVRLRPARHTGVPA